jgi:hypothetical protein
MHSIIKAFYARSNGRKAQVLYPNLSRYLPQITKQYPQSIKFAIVAARNSQGERILAHTRPDADALNQLLSEDPIGRSGQVRIEDGLNVFEL